MSFGNFLIKQVGGGSRASVSAGEDVCDALANPGFPRWLTRPRPSRSVATRCSAELAALLERLACTGRADRTTIVR